ncbi:hypothetical protein ASG93_01975 [Paenibacillus sp. Soil787]|nr:hypothetical protein ASG93_01975 [Paenibacillus sp. Soil787]
MIAFLLLISSAKNATIARSQHSVNRPKRCRAPRNNCALFVTEDQSYISIMKSAQVATRGDDI